MGKKMGFLVLVLCVATGSAFAGTYANITIDGNFADWVDVPLSASDPLDNASGVDLADIKVANDNDYIYVYLSLHAAADPFAGTDHYFIDGDGNLATGFQVFGGLLGSELLLQGPAAYQEANGGFNEGTLAAGTIIQAPFAVSATEFEFRIDRAVVGVAAPFLGLSLITSNNIEFLFWQNNGVQDTVQFNYTMASEPPCPGPPTTFRTITIDGDFADWTNIPAAAVDGTDPSVVDYAVIRVANDADNLYFYMRLHGLADPFTFTSNYFFDGDNNIATGFPTFSVGSEILVQGASAFQQAGGGFNEGTLAAGTVLQSPFATLATEFEFSVDRNAVGVAAPFVGVPLLTGSTVRMSFQGDNGNDVLEFDYTFFNSVCPGAIAPAGVDGEGRPLGDLNGDCVVDLQDYQIFQVNLTGP
jgi:hypothetical protein